ncbi:helix-turn-helix domain-containing protein [Saccharopolyspora sp. NPDC050389]|uniref:sigma-54-dependent Fis family transcriptional regulator n=1 Tax=Saccharopolyspora sp. NPDC050389 TaxID=3155516 RepID=UPI003406D830
MGRISEGAARLRRERDRLLEDQSGLAHPDPTARPELREDIISSWRRCQLVGVAPSSDEVPYAPEFDRPGRLLRAAAPVIDGLAEQLLGCPATIVLADSRAQIIERRAGGRELANALDRAMVSPGFHYAEEYTGTNGIGSALEERKPFAVQGAEHFRENLVEFSCIGSPVVHPISRAVEGVLDVTCRVADANVLMKPFVLSAVREIESRMYADASLRERMLLEHFLRASRKSSSAVVSLNEDFLITNTAAAKLLEPSDQALIWDWASRMLLGRDECSGEIRLAQDVVVQARGTKVVEEGRLAGVLVEMRVRSSGAITGGGARRARQGESAPEINAAVLPGRSVVAERLRREVDAAVEAHLPLLLSGEAGAGKLFVAEHVHERWAAGAAFTVLDALAAHDDPEAWIDRLDSHVGTEEDTVVLRHLDVLPAGLCGRVGRMLDRAGGNRAHVIATTKSRSSAGECARLFDYFPMSVVVPPLRYRAEDIADIAPLLIRRHTVQRPAPRLQPGTLQALMALDWPGNVRELDSVLSTALMRSMGFDIAQAHLPTEYRSAPARRRMASLERAERDTILDALADTGGNKLAAAERLGIARSTLYRKLRALGIDDNRFSI